MKPRFFIIIGLLFVSSSVFSQQYPYKINAGATQSVSANNGKLWVLTDNQFRETIEKGMLLDTCIAQNDLLKQQVALLKEISDEKQDLIDSLKNDRDFYIQKHNECEDDVESLLSMNDKFYKQRNIAIIVGSATTVTAFVVGFILGIK